ncbi:hypothetical protein B0H10DRAFT_2443289 [Mycena sp. CBHHK59/15]|nr:hypothetical protein B0H10DRAFT_2443289 [Mycena sp. CBHHK59/15]
MCRLSPSPRTTSTIRHATGCLLMAAWCPRHCPPNPHATCLRSATIRLIPGATSVAATTECYPNVTHIDLFPGPFPKIPPVYYSLCPPTSTSSASIPFIHRRFLFWPCHHPSSPLPRPSDLSTRPSPLVVHERLITSRVWPDSAASPSLLGLRH